MTLFVKLLKQKAKEISVALSVVFVKSEHSKEEQIAFICGSIQSFSTFGP